MTTNVTTLRGVRGALTAAFLGLLLSTQPLANALHFVTVEHGVVTEDGALGHGHEHHHHHGHGHACEDAQGDTYGPEAPSEVSSCGYLAMILRGEEGEDDGDGPAFTSILPRHTEHRPPIHVAPAPHDPLPGAPKHSPPAA